VRTAITDSRLSTAIADSLVKPPNRGREGREEVIGVRRGE
jgi:hypothetical protein